MVQEDEIVLCTVKKIEGTVVSVAIHCDGEGTINFSEVSPGRIRNIREFVVPNKIIACKVLRVKGNHIELSLRRVTGKEREEAMEKYNKEKTVQSILKPILKEKLESTISRIKAKYDLSEFLDKARENNKLVSEFLNEEETKQFLKIFTEKKEKAKEVKKIITIRSMSSSGVKEIQKALSIEDKQIQIHYLGSSQFSVTATATDFKIANHKIGEAIEKIKEASKSLKIICEVKEK